MYEILVKFNLQDNIQIDWMAAKLHLQNRWVEYEYNEDLREIIVFDIDVAVEMIQWLLITEIAFSLSVDVDGTLDDDDY